MNHDLFTTFDRVVVISLQRRPDRLAGFQQRIAEVNWPLRSIDVVTAIDGDRCNPPSWYVDGNGAWGCLRSHIRCLEDAQNDRINSILVLEDDAYFLNPNMFVDDLQQFINNVPADWDCLFLGGQHFNTAPVVAPGVVKATNIQRTHAYAVRGKLISDLYKFWTNCKTHCDHPIGTFTAKYKTYAPDPFLFGQEAGSSDISGRVNQRQSWSKSKKTYPVVAVKGNRQLIEQLKAEGFHRGYTLDANGVDVGLAAALNARNADDRTRGIAALIEVLNGECDTAGHKAVMLWPGNDLGAIRAACPSVIELNNPTIEEARAICTKS